MKPIKGTWIPFSLSQKFYLYSCGHYNECVCMGALVVEMQTTM